MNFLKEHLHNGDYNRAVGLNHSLYNNAPDRRIFDRLNGYQVLFIINYFGQSVGNLTVTDGRRIENLISTQLPGEIKSELSVFNWLRDNYLYYSN
jgi:hypothetical protein